MVGNLPPLGASCHPLLTTAVIGSRALFFCGYSNIFWEKTGNSSLKTWDTPYEAPKEPVIDVLH